MKHLAYFKDIPSHYKSEHFLLSIVGIGTVTSQTSSSYGIMGFEYSGRDIGINLEGLVKNEGWRRASAVVEKTEKIEELTTRRYNKLLSRIQAKL